MEGSIGKTIVEFVVLSVEILLLAVFVCGLCIDYSVSPAPKKLKKPKKPKRRKQPTFEFPRASVINRKEKNDAAS